MLRKSWCPSLTKLQISGLRGGEKHDFYYFIGISETALSDLFTDVIYVRLRNQMGSQKSSQFPEGYEPFATPYGTQELCLRKMAIAVPRVKLFGVGWPNPTPTPRIIVEGKPACIIAPPVSSEAFRVLKTAAEVFEVKHRIRRQAAESHARLILVDSLMEYPGNPPICNDPADRFEAHLSLRGPEFLRDLRTLLEMPDPLQREPMAEFPCAA